MKKKIIYAVFFILMVFAAHSCSTGCKNCKLVTRDSSGNIVGTPGSPTQYCSVELTAIEATPPTTVGGNTTKYECE